MDDRSTLSDDEGIGHDQSDEEDISQRAIHQALKASERLRSRLLIKLFFL